MSNFELTYKLKQQTPLIHFHHDQSGATLRASEVKPKLDKFILSKLGNNIPNSWLIGETKALNYKMRIVASGKPTRSKYIDYEIQIDEKNVALREKYALKRTMPRTDSNSIQINNEISKIKSEIERLKKLRDAQINGMYFGNMVSDESNDYREAVQNTYKETVFYGENQIKLVIICFIEELKTKIDDNIEEFFFINNFGTRQSKGFGGFTISKENSKTDVIKLLSKKGYEYFYVDIKGNPNHTDLMNHAKNIYAVMKGGYNHTGWNERDKCYRYQDRYIKGYIHRRFIDVAGYKDYGSDKAFIKSKKKLRFDKDTGKTYEYPKERRGQPNENNYDDKYIFVRALLGLADHYEFRDSARNGNVNIFCLGDSKFEIERFRSPVTIKIIDNKIIFLFGSFKEICGKDFYFAPNGIPTKDEFDKKSYNDKKTYILDNPKLFFKISTPKDFNVVNFIHGFVEYFEGEKQKFSHFSNPTIKMSENLNLVIPE